MPRQSSWYQKLFYIFFSPKKRAQEKLIFDTWFKTDNIYFPFSSPGWCGVILSLHAQIWVLLGEVNCWHSVLYFQVLTHTVGSLYDYSLMLRSWAAHSSYSFPDVPSSCHEPAWMLSSIGRKPAPLGPSHWSEKCKDEQEKWEPKWFFRNAFNCPWRNLSLIFNTSNSKLIIWTQGHQMAKCHQILPLFPSLHSHHFLKPHTISVGPEGISLSS